MRKSFSVILTIPGDEPIHYRLSDGRLVVGRSSSSAIRLEVPAVSSRHCHFERTAEGYRLVDLQSTNGTRINGQRVMDPTGVLLKNGDRILLGETVEGHFIEAIEAETTTSPLSSGSVDQDPAPGPLAVWVDAADDSHPDEAINPVAAAVARQQESLAGVGSSPV